MSLIRPQNSECQRWQAVAGDLWEHLHDLLMELLHYARHVQEPILLRLQGCLCLLQCSLCPLLQLLQVMSECLQEPHFICLLSDDMTESFQCLTTLRPVALSTRSKSFRVLDIKIDAVQSYH